jgi:hypothetical protein
LAYTDDNDVEHYGVYNNDTGGYDVTDDDGDKHGYAEEEFSDERFYAQQAKYGTIIFSLTQSVCLKMLLFP